jgi:hypothetical protein
MRYSITNRTSGQYLGIYGGETPEDAVAEMDADAGYSSTSWALDVLGMTRDERLADLLIEEVVDDCPEGGYCGHARGAMECQGYKEGTTSCSWQTWSKP